MRESKILHFPVEGVTAVGDVVRSYIYYSDDKIHELDQQLPEAKWWHRIQGGGATVLGTGGNIDFGPQETKPILRTMQKVWRYLDRMQQVGSFDEPRQYFYGRLAFYLEFFDSVNPQLLFLIGDTGQTVVALGGQKKHVRGFRDQQSGQRAGAPSIVIETDLVRYWMWKSRASQSSQGSPVTMQGDSWNELVVDMYSRWKGEKTEFEVLAARESFSQATRPGPKLPRSVLIGSPIFVAQA
jgi:hypothetical protein